MKKNALLKHNPELIDEWNFDLNNELGLDIYNITYGSNKKVWWICKDCGSNYFLRVAHKVNGSRCCYCTGQSVNHTNSLESLRPDIASQWHPTKNGDLTPKNVTCGTTKKVWWVCSICESDFYSYIGGRVAGRGCTYCSSNAVNHTNSLSAKKPRLARYWHPTKNGDLTPDKIAPNSSKKVWWLGECGHEFKYTPNGKDDRSNICPYCSNYNAQLLVGFNDMWTTNPKLASLLANPEDGYKYMQSSNKRLDFKCSDCESLIKSRVISSIKQAGLSCPICSDGILFPEKFMYHMLDLSGLNFTYQKTFDWLKGKRYDFYIEDHNTIIETHGVQHYIQTNRKNSPSLEEEQLNDKLKENTAKSNGISNYIILNCSDTSLNIMKEMILNSELHKIIKSTDIEKAYMLSANSFIKTACDLWNSGIKSTETISKRMKLSSGTIRKYLKIGVEIGWCDYCPEEALRRGAILTSEKKKKPVAQLTLDYKLVKMWESATEASRIIGNIHQGGISAVCSNKQKTAGGYRWMYLNDYNKMNEVI